MKGGLSREENRRIAKALADPLRCDLLERVARAGGELPCAELVAMLPVSQATVSHHFKELVMAKLLERRKQGQFVFYRFRADVMQAYLRELAARLKLER